MSCVQSSFHRGPWSLEPKTAIRVIASAAHNHYAKTGQVAERQVNLMKRNNCALRSGLTLSALDRSQGFACGLRIRARV